jgi:hypothetical protein
MERFIWIGNRLINLDCIVSFTVENNGAQVVVLLRDVDSPEERTIAVEGAAAEPLMHVLTDVELGKRMAFSEGIQNQRS